MLKQDTSLSHESRIADQSRNGERLRILFTEGASLSARQTLYPLGGRHEIDVIDPDPLCQCRFSSFVRRYFRSPSFAREPVKFLRFLEDLNDKRNYDVVLPTHEQAYLLSRFRDSLSRRVGMAMPPFASLERLQNKAEFSRLLTELCLPQPQTVSVRGWRELDCAWTYPFYLKHPHSTAGNGVFLIQQQGDLQRPLALLKQQKRFDDQTELLVQQPGRGVFSTVQAVFSRGQLVGVHTMESLRNGIGGMSTARVSCDHAIVREHVAKIGQRLDWHGALFIDYFYDQETSQPEYIECNPRMGEPVNAMLSGLNLAELVVQIAHGEHPQPQPRGRDGVHTHNLMMILMSAAHDGQSRAAIIRELRDCFAARGVYAGSEDEITRPRQDSLSRLPRLWITLQLLGYPAIARRIVLKTVDNYSLPAAATNVIKALPLDLLDT